MFFTYGISIPHSIYYYFIGLRNYFSGVVPELYRRTTEDTIQNGRFLLAMKQFNQLSSVGLAVLDSNSKLRCSKSMIFGCDLKGMKDVILLQKGSFPNIRVHLQRAVQKADVQTKLTADYPLGHLIMDWSWLIRIVSGHFCMPLPLRQKC